MIPSLLLALVVVSVGIIVFCLVILFSYAKNEFSRTKPHRHIQSDLDRIRSGQLRGKEKELIRLLYGDKQTAMRLIDHVRTRNPEKSHKWCVEKAIEDLEYDRRR